MFSHNNWATVDDNVAPTAIPSKNNARRTRVRIKETLEKIGVILLMFLALSLCIGGLIFIITHISVRPSVKILSMSVSPIDLSADDSKITANWTIELEFGNPNKKHPINYSEIEVSVSYYGYEVLGTAKVAPFVQSPKNQTKLIAEPEALGRSLGNGQVGSAIRRDLYDDGDVSFDVNVRLQFEYEKDKLGGPGDRNYERGRNKPPAGYTNFLCGGVGVSYPASDERSSGIMRGGSKRCHYYKNN